MSDDQVNATVLLAEGPLGRGYIKYLTASGKIDTISGFFRGYDPSPGPRPPHFGSAVINDVSLWPIAAPGYPLAYSALGVFPQSAATTVVDGGETDLQWNVEIAKAVKEKGTKTYVMVIPPIAQSKGAWCRQPPTTKLEQDMINLGLETLIILKPGPIMDGITSIFPWGGTTQVKNEFTLRSYGTQLEWLAGYPVYCDDIALAAVSLSFRLSKGVYEISPAQIVQEVERAKQDAKFASLRRSKSSKAYNLRATALLI